VNEAKIGTYLGFCKRAGKLVLGVTAATVKKGVYLLVVDRDVKKNSRKEIDKLQRKFSCPIAFVDKLEELVFKENCKLAAVREPNLAKAILETVEEGDILGAIPKEEESGETERKARVSRARK